jgi:hypothetical protein
MMSTATRAHRVANADLFLAFVLLVGILVTGYGFFQASRIALYSGLFITIGGVLSGAMRLAGHRQSRPHKG